MADKPVAQKISLAVQDFIYRVADDLTTIVDEALEAFEDAAEALEDKVTPVYHYTVNVDGDVQKVVSDFKRETAKQSPSKTGGSQTTLQEALSVVYDYLRDTNQLGELEHSDKDKAIEGYKSTISREFKTAVYRSILGSSYYKGVENIEI